MYKNFEQIVNENYQIICKVDLNPEKPIQLKSNKSFKVMNEIPLILMLTYNIFPEQISQIIQNNIPIIVSVFKVLKPNPYKGIENDTTKKISN